MESPANSAMLPIGTKCASAHCDLNDFLPFKCQHCSESFCSDHYKPTAHRCEKFDPLKHDRVAPPCPFCKTPIAIPQGGDPNLAMEKHFDTACVVLGNSDKKKGAPHCANAKCRKALYVDIKCSDCKRQFCPSHRYPADHTCVSTTAKPSSAPSSRPTGSTSSLPSRASAATNAAQAAMARAATQLKAKSQPSTPPKPSTSSSSTPAVAAGSSKVSSNVKNPFSKTDRCEPSSTASSASAKPTTAPTTPAAPSPRSPKRTPLNDIAEKPKPHHNNSFAPPPLFATA
ncbi:hypothetical protein BOTBODRAFT_35315 [Botryobasidium botryosum FD-172 SS1]|uniref:AN1-type domain-containing protein n=1 Tax=Botryobasidium botryosum (strain FD-172 SS1) TaxID=930990 RepID=A0A067M7B0_BOTB1|nr:hypothetical protein BOTBODRAFT_35315 [Botryobasidium botryosum FD-172 SS1]